MTGETSTTTHHVLLIERLLFGTRASSAWHRDYSHCGGGEGLFELVSDWCRSGIPCIGPTSRTVLGQSLSACMCCVLSMCVRSSKSFWDASGGILTL